MYYILYKKHSLITFKAHEDFYVIIFIAIYLSEVVHFMSRIINYFMLLRNKGNVFDIKCYKYCQI